MEKLQAPAIVSAFDLLHARRVGMGKWGLRDLTDVIPISTDLIDQLTNNFSQGIGTILFHENQ